MAKKPKRVTREIPIDDFESPGLLGDLTDLKGGNALTQRLGQIRPIPPEAFQDPDFGTNQSQMQRPGMMDQMQEMAGQAGNALRPTGMAMQNDMQQGGDALTEMLNRARQGADQGMDQAHQLLDQPTQQMKQTALEKYNALKQQLRQLNKQGAK